MKQLINKNKSLFTVQFSFKFSFPVHLFQTQIWLYEYTSNSKYLMDASNVLKSLLNLCFKVVHRSSLKQMFDHDRFILFTYR